MARIYLKDKESFLKEYEKERNNELKEIVAWRNSIIEGKVEVKIMIPCFEKETKKVLEKIKD